MTMYKRYGISWGGGPPYGGFHTENTLRDALKFARNNRGHMNGPVFLLGSKGRGGYSDQAVSSYAKKRFAVALLPVQP